MAEWPFLSGNTQFPKGTAQLVVAGVRFPVRRLKDPFQKKPLGLQIRLPGHHCHAGDSTSGFILLHNTSHLELDSHWNTLKLLLGIAQFSQNLLDSAKSRFYVH